jgi:RNA polymerase sigma-70 factor (ECF subfamily)
MKKNFCKFKPLLKANESLTLKLSCYFCKDVLKIKSELIITAEIKALTDEQIIDRYKLSSDKNLVGELYKRHTRFVYLVSMKYLKDEDRSKDAVMQIFEKLFDDFHKHKIEKFKPWLHTVTRNFCLIALRQDQTKAKKDKKMLADSDFFMESDDELHLDGVDNSQKHIDCLKDALQALNHEQKICIEMFYIQEKSYKEIIEETGFSESKVKSYIQNGKRNLKIKILGINSMITLILYLVFID